MSFVDFGVAKNELTLVTAFFDVGDAPYKAFRGSKEALFKNFKKWAGVKNNLVVFYQGESVKEEILKIRKGYNLESKTKLINVEGDVFKIEKDIYQRMVTIGSNALFQKMRVVKNTSGDNAQYAYLNVMKSYFLNKANLGGDVKTDSVAWVDFGFDHGGDVYSSENDWSFTAEYSEPDKVTLFYVPPKLDSRPIFEIIRTVQPTSVINNFFICPTKQVGTFWELFRNSTYRILYLGMMDNDPSILLLASRVKADLFVLKESQLNSPFKIFCNGEPPKDIKGGKKKDDL